MMRGEHIPGARRRDRSWPSWWSSRSSWVGEVVAIRTVSKTVNVGSSPTRPVWALRESAGVPEETGSGGRSWFGCTDRPSASSAPFVGGEKVYPWIRKRKRPVMWLRGTLTQLVAYRAFTPGVLGSIPRRPIHGSLAKLVKHRALTPGILGSTPRRPILEGGRSPTGKRCWTKNPEVVSSSLTARMESGKMKTATIRQKEIQGQKSRRPLDVRLGGAVICTKGVMGRWVRG